MQGMVYLGEVTSPPYFEKSASVGNLRRDVRWYNADEPIDGSELHAPVPALLQSQAYVVDLTEAYDQLAALIPGREEEKPPSVRAIEKPQRTLSLRPVTAELAADLLMDAAEVEKIRDLLWERKQLIFYGPPGTGKTYLATRLARHLTEDGAVKLVQFHPSVLPAPSQSPASGYRAGIARPCILAMEKIEQKRSDDQGGIAVASYRPMTVADLASHLMQAADDRTRWKLVWEFLEEYRWEPGDIQPILLRDEPPPIGDERWDVLLAALAEHLAAQHDLAPPAWAEMRVLQRPWFPAELRVQRADALVRAPAAFRKHGVYLSAADLQAA